MALYGHTWNDQMLKMLGKAFTVLDVTQTNSDMVAIAVSSPDGSNNGKWYFPSIVFSKSGIVIFRLSFQSSQITYSLLSSY